MGRVKIKPKMVWLLVIGLLAAVLIAMALALVQKNKAITTAMATIEQKDSAIAKADKEIEKLEGEITDQAAELREKLETAEKEKKRLEQENESLKKEIETLRAKKEKGKPKKLAGSQGQSATSVALSNQAATPSTSKVCYLTFDDGPSDNTLKILNILEEHQAKATFFVINSDHIDYTAKIEEAGHSIGLHTASHNYAKIYQSTDAFFADLKTISDKVEQYAGVKSDLIRFPGGSSNTVSKKYCKGIMTKLTGMATEAGYSYFDWNICSGDADSATPKYQVIRDNVLNSAKNKNSICVLMHDSAAKTSTVQALPEIIDGLKKMGYTFQALTPESCGYHHHVNN